MWHCCTVLLPVITWKERYQLWMCLLGDVQKLDGHIPGQPSSGGPPGAGILDQRPPDIPSNLDHSVILWSSSRTLMHSYKHLLNPWLDTFFSLRFRLFLMTTSPMQCLDQSNAYYCGFPNALSNVFAISFQANYVQSSTNDKEEVLVKIDWQLQYYSPFEDMNTCIYMHFMN